MAQGNGNGTLSEPMVSRNGGFRKARTASMPSFQGNRRLSWGRLNTGSGTNLGNPAESMSVDLSVWHSKSPLMDLTRVAQPGVSQRVMRRNSVSVHADAVHMAFTDSSTELNEAEIAEVLGGLTSTLCLATVAACMPAMQYGFNLASMNTAAPVMRSDLGIPSVGPDGTVQAQNQLIWSFCVSALPLAGIFGAKAGAAVADKFGRRKGLVLLSISFVIGACLCAFSKFFVQEGQMGWSPGVVLFIVGRLICGLAGGATTVVVPKYIGEISPPHLRGALGAVFQTSQVCWMLLTQVLGLPNFMGTVERWQMYVLMLEILPALVLLILIPFLVESPFWAAEHHAHAQEMVYQILMKLRGYELNDADLAQEAEHVMPQEKRQREGSQGTSFGDLWADDAARQGLIIAVVVGASQQLSGINNVFNYSTQVMADNNVSADIITVIAIAMNVGNVINSILASALLDRAGRRPLLLGSASVMCASALVLSLALAIQHSTMIIVSTVGFVMSFGIGMGPLPWLLPCELFSPEFSSLGVSTASTINWLANFIVAMTFPMIAQSMQGLCFLPNAIFLAFFTVWAWRTIPETRGKTLDQIVQSLKGGNGVNGKVSDDGGLNHPITLSA